MKWPWTQGVHSNICMAFMHASLVWFAHIYTIRTVEYNSYKLGKLYSLFKVNNLYWCNFPIDHEYFCIIDRCYS